MRSHEAVNKMPEQARKRAQRMQQHARSAALKRKEEFLGARVPRELRSKVIARATQLGIPVSILIRNILEAAFDERTGSTARENVAATTPGMGTDSVAGSTNDTGMKIANVLGWEAITLNQDLPCARCTRQLRAGESVTLGFVLAGQDPVILCNSCKAAV